MWSECQARAGIGELTVVDSDVISLSNLNRQLLALNSTVGMPKAQAAGGPASGEINPNAIVHPIQGTYDAQHRDLCFPEGCRYDYIVRRCCCQLQD